MYINWLELADLTLVQNEWFAEAGERFCMAQIEIFESKLRDQLRNRYAVDDPKFGNVTVRAWIAAQVAQAVCVKRGIDPTDVVYSEIKSAADAARSEIDSAADSDVGKYELPTLDQRPVSVVFRARSDADPGAWKRRQAKRAAAERDGR